MTYTAPEMLLIITAVGGVIVNIIIAWKTSNKVDATLVKASVIEGHVNSEKAQLNEQLKSHQTEILLLRNMLSDKDRTAALLAQSLAQTSFPITNKEEKK